MKIAMIGAGYVGLTSAACFAEFGSTVTCVDNVKEKIDALNKGHVPFFEPGLAELVRKNTEKGRLAFTSDMAGAVREAEAVFIAVGTPSGEDGSTDLSYMEAAARETGRAMDSYKLIVIKSTVPVGTGRRMRAVIEGELASPVQFDMASNPEFLREGVALDDFMRPDRVVIGAESERAIHIMKEIYKPLEIIETPFVFTTVQTAELIKYASNCFLATKISFINEMANLCDVLGADVQTVSRAVGLDSRIGARFLHPGPGFGGSCFPKDLKSLIHTARQSGSELRVINAAHEANEAQWRLLAERAKSAMGGELKGKVVAMLGLAFKPRTDDVREAPALKMARLFIEQGADVRGVDPEAMENAMREVPGLQSAPDAYEAAKGADAIMLLTEWSEFGNLDLKRLKGLMRDPVFVDMRNVYDPVEMAEAGFTYLSVGRPASLTS